MDRQIELYLDEICGNLKVTEGRKSLVREELRSHLEEMIADYPVELSDERVEEVIRREFGKPKKLGNAMNKTFKKGGYCKMERKSFIRRIVMPPMLIFGVFLLMLLGNKLAGSIPYKPLWYVAKAVTGSLIVASFIGAPGIVSLLCFYQGGNLLERLLLGFIPPFVFIILGVASQVSFSVFIWVLFNPAFTAIIGGAALQIAFVEIWALYKMRKYHAASVA